MKKILFLIIAVSCLLIGSSCDLSFDGKNGEIINELTRVATPYNIQYDDDTKQISWSYIENASGYYIRINEDNPLGKLSDNFYILSKNESMDFVVQVWACGNGITFSDSLKATSSTFHYTYNTTEEVNVDFNTISKMLTLGLGGGINTITGTYLDFGDGATKPRGDFFNYTNLLENDGIDVRAVSMQSGELKTFDANSISQFALDFSTKYSHSSSSSLGVDVGGLFGFSSGLENNFSVSKDFSITNKTTQYYNIAYQNYASKRYYISNFEDLYKSNDLLSNGVKERLDLMKDYTGTELDNAIDNFFNIYGTHIVTDVVTGGKIEMYYSLISNDFSIDSNTVFNYSNTLKAGFNESIIGSSKNVEATNQFDTALHINNQDENTSTNFIVKTYGGNAFTSNSFSKLSEGYKDWIEDFNRQTDKNTIVDLPSNSLVPIWNMIPNDYSTIVNKMKQRFTTKLSSVNEEFKNKFSINTSIDKPIGNEGENASNPYLIKSKEDLNKYLNEDTAEKYFKLTEDIDFSNESCIPFKKFFGVFDGNNHKIRNVNINIQGNEGLETTDAGAYYVGLWQYIYGSVSNLTLENVTFTCNNALDKYVRAGTLTGGLYGGSINNCHATGVMTMKNGSYSLWAGGLVGYSENGIIDMCSANVTVNAASSGNILAGGLVGYSCGKKVSASYATGNVNASNVSSSAYIITGGLIGLTEKNLVSSNNTIVENCYATGEIISNVTSSYTCSGGLIGKAKQTDVSYVYSTSIVTGKSQTYKTFVGGLVGSSLSSSITHAFASGDVYSRGNYSGIEKDHSFFGHLFGEERDNRFLYLFYNPSGKFKDGNYGTEITWGDVDWYTGVGTSIMQSSEFQQGADKMNLNPDIWKIVNGKYPTLKFE